VARCCWWSNSAPATSKCVVVSYEPLAKTQANVALGIPPERALKCTGSGIPPVLRWSGVLSPFMIKMNKLKITNEAIKKKFVYASSNFGNYPDIPQKSLYANSVDRPYRLIGRRRDCQLSTKPMSKIIPYISYLFKVFNLFPHELRCLSEDRPEGRQPLAPVTTSNTLDFMRVWDFSPFLQPFGSVQRARSTESA
jgi:hypothetical protein